MRSFVFVLLAVWSLLGENALAAEPPVARTPLVFFMIGEPEYDTPLTLPAFARAELEPHGIRSTFSILTDEKTEEFPNFAAVKEADLLFISVRRHAPPPEQMALIRAHVAAGKPVVGIRTASHAFGKRKGEKEGTWETFDAEVLGGNYQGHYGKDAVTFAKIVPAAAAHPILAGLGPEEFRVAARLYKNPKLPPHVTILLTARLEGRPEEEPVAGVNPRAAGRVFYTSLGSAEDFEVPQFRLLLRNGVRWALGLPSQP